jgi:hypothetical protein
VIISTQEKAVSAYEHIPTSLYALKKKGKQLKCYVFRVATAPRNLQPPPTD